MTARLCPATGAGPRTIQCWDPRTGADTATLPCTPVDQVASRVAAARAAGAAWAATPLDQRIQALRRLHQAFLGAADELATLLAEECGRPPGEAWTAEIVANDGLFRWWLASIEDLLVDWPLSLSPLEYPGKRGRVVLAPKGVIGLITPWNLPVAIPLRTLVPALLAGNAVVWKPSEHTARLGARLAALCDAALPAGLVQLVQGDALQGAAVVDSDVDMVVFTGSHRAGVAVATAAAPRLLPVSLELGGNDAAVVFPDADLDRAAAGIVWGAFAFGGQNCAAIERCYVHSTVWEPFVAAVQARIAALDRDRDLNPLVTPAQVDKVRAQLKAAIAGGARVLAGGLPEGEDTGQWLPPTLLADVDPAQAVVAEETFGPVLPLLPWTDLDPLLDQINASPFALTTSLWTRDPAAAEALVPRLRSGVVTVNNHSFTGALPDAPWTGPGATGGGVTNSRFALYGLVRPRTVVVDGTRGDRELWWYPYLPALTQIGRGMVALRRRGGPRLQGARAALTGLLNRWKGPES